MVCRAERPRLARQNDEHRLGDFLGQMRVAHLPQCHGIHQIDVARDEHGERLFGIVPSIFPQQSQVVIRHFTHTFTPPGKGNNLFLLKTIFCD